jgi:hypothetical protein
MSTERSASIEALNRIHRKLAEAIDAELQSILDSGDNLPANLINAVSAFLKANEITADVRDNDDLERLRKQLSELRGRSLVMDAQETDYLS